MKGDFFFYVIFFWNQSRELQGQPAWRNMTAGSWSSFEEYLICLFCSVGSRRSTSQHGLWYAADTDAQTHGKANKKVIKSVRLSLYWFYFLCVLCYPHLLPLACQFGDSSTYCEELGHLRPAAEESGRCVRASGGEEIPSHPGWLSCRNVALEVMVLRSGEAPWKERKGLGTDHPKQYLSPSDLLSVLQLDASGERWSALTANAA